MSIITIREVVACTRQDVVSDTDLSSHAPANLAITESELMCDELIFPDFHLPAPLPPTTECAETRLLAFETAETAPLYLMPTACGKRPRQESGDVTRPCSLNNPGINWMTSINWNHFE